MAEGLGKGLGKVQAKGSGTSLGRLWVRVYIGFRQWFKHSSGKGLNKDLDKGLGKGLKRIQVQVYIGFG